MRGRAGLARPVARAAVAALLVPTIRGVALLTLGIVDPVQPPVCQGLFGMTFSMLITLEFNRTVLGVLQRRHSIVQVRTVVLVIARGFAILDFAEADAIKLHGLTPALVLGSVRWPVREHDRRHDAAQQPQRP